MYARAYQRMANGPTLTATGSIAGSTMTNVAITTKKASVVGCDRTSSGSGQSDRRLSSLRSRSGPLRARDCDHGQLIAGTQRKAADHLDPMPGLESKGRAE